MLKRPWVINLRSTAFIGENGSQKALLVQTTGEEPLFFNEFTSQDFTCQTLILRVFKALKLMSNSYFLNMEIKTVLFVLVSLYSLFHDQKQHIIFEFTGSNHTASCLYLAELMHFPLFPNSVMSFVISRTPTHHFRERAVPQHLEQRARL